MVKKKWFESVTSMVMQSVPPVRATNRLIRGNRTGVQNDTGRILFIETEIKDIGTASRIAKQIFDQETDLIILASAVWRSGLMPVFGFIEGIVKSW